MAQHPLSIGGASGLGAETQPQQVATGNPPLKSGRDATGREDDAAAQATPKKRIPVGWALVGLAAFSLAAWIGIAYLFFR